MTTALCLTSDLIRQWTSQRKHPWEKKWPRSWPGTKTPDWMDWCEKEYKIKRGIVKQRLERDIRKRAFILHLNDGILFHSCCFFLNSFFWAYFRIYSRNFFVSIFFLFRIHYSCRVKISEFGLASQIKCLFTYSHHTIDVLTAMLQT